MSKWYKIAKKESEFIVSSYYDRNIVLGKITAIKNIINQIEYARAIVFQSTTTSKKIFANLATLKVLSSYPSWIQIIKDTDKYILDNPKSFQEKCVILEQAMNKEIKKLHKSIEKFIQEISHKEEK